MRQTCSTTISILRNFYHRHFSSTTKKLPSITKIIPYNHRSQAIQDAQEVLTDYFHNTRALPFTYAEHISKNSKHSLYYLISKLPFSSSGFRRTFQRFLRYNPINEFGFFYESIGIDYVDIDEFLKPNLHFLDDDSVVLAAAFCLSGFGFPWGKLGRLYVEEVSIFSKNGGFLRGRLDGLVSLGFGNEQVVAVCLAFPCLLKGEEVEFGSDFDALLDDLKRVFVDFDLGTSVVGNVDGWFEVCRKIKFFYDLGVAEGVVGKLICKSKSTFILSDYSEDVFVEKVEFFSRLGFEKSEVGVLILSNPNILSIRLHDRVISVSSILDHFGLPEENLLSVKQNYSYVFGRNKMVNLPNILKAMDLHEWFFDRMKCGYHSLFANYDLSSPEDGVDENYVQNLESVKSLRTRSYSFGKLNFFHRIGFGENSFTMKLLVDVHGSPSDLQDRFDFLLNEGVEYSKLCKIISRVPKVLSQEIDGLKKKLDFFVEEIGLPLDYLETFPAYLLYNLEKRIKPRFEFYVWLTEQGWCTKKYTLGSIIAVSHKSFVAQLSRMHPTAPQLWLEQNGNRK
ncbi:hypothetical protein RND81_02G107600 [Saponaria officinalis]|uniref:Transcription termination factor MTEF18, mitochondrial n=1 Tax=Saponaria officinalis TaxID=3572 RepID=A0AAW1MT08_SAPOF